MKTTLFDNILETLKFNQQSEDGLLTTHFERVSQLLAKSVAHLSPSAKRVFSALSHVGRARLVLSPNVSESLYLIEKGRELSEQIERFIFSEGAREGICQSPIPFSSMSDICFDDEIQYKALSLECGILLDYNGLFHKEESCYSYEEVMSFKHTLDMAMNYIQSVCPHTFQFILSHTVMISLFRDNGRYQSNFSSDIAIGKIHSLNFERIQDDFCEVVDFLVHETIHNYLHLIEEDIAQFLPDHEMGELSGERLAKSPWTGNMICPQSYTHAICVWYGLANFWTKADRINKREETKKMYNECVKGFFSGNVLSGLENFKSKIHPDFLFIVGQMTKSLEQAHVA